MTALPQTMTAIGFDAPGGPEVLKPQQRPVPQPGPGQILVHVAVAGVNRPDIQQRRGLYPPPPGATGTPGDRPSAAAASARSTPANASAVLGRAAMIPAKGIACQKPRWGAN